LTLLVDFRASYRLHYLGHGASGVARQDRLDEMIEAYTRQVEGAPTPPTPPRSLKPSPPPTRPPATEYDVLTDGLAAPRPAVSLSSHLTVAVASRGLA
jgi:hypothetical protein